MTNLLDKSFLTTAEFAEVLRTNDVTIRQSRRSGMLYGRPAPVHKRMGLRKIMYSSDVIKEWLDSIPDSRKTDEPEPEGLRSARED